MSDRLCCIRWQSCSVTAATWQSWQCQVLPDSQLTSHGDCTQPIIVVWPTTSCFADWLKCCHVTFIIIIEWSRDQHHCKLSQLISINLQCVTTVLIIKNATVSKSQNVKDRSRANKYLRKIKVNLRSKVGLCISTYSNADVVRYSSAIWQTELNDVHLTDGGSYTLNKNQILS